MRSLTTVRTSLAFLAVASPLSLLPIGETQAADKVVNVYTYRQPVLIEPLFEAFTQESGIKVQYIFAEKGLIERIQQEDRSSPADLLLTADVGRLVEATEKGLAQPVDSAAIKASVPENLRDPGSQWFGLTMRGRVVYVSKERVKQQAISYEELADPKWKGKICIRSGQHPYNVELVAAVIAHKGEDAARTWLQGVKANLARKPAGNDRAQAKGVFAGECDLAVANTYYLGKMLTEEKEPEQKQWAEAVRIIFPSSPEMGTHVNISGVLMTKHAPNRENALKLMEFLASGEAQRIYAEANFEYPVSPSVQPSELVRSWGTFTPDNIPISKLAEYQKAASKLVDEVQFDD